MQIRHVVLRLTPLVALFGCGEGGEVPLHEGMRGGTARSDAAVEGEDNVGARARYDLEAETWLAAPWPSDRARDERGHPRLDHLPLPEVGLARQYRDLAESVLDGFGLNGAVYFPFDAPMDAAALPAVESTATDPHGRAQLVNVSPASPRYGERVPLRFAAPRQPDRYVPPNVVAMAPLPGFPLAAGDTYCAFLTTRVRDAMGHPIRPDPGFAQHLAAEPSLAPLRDWLAGEPIPPEELATATCFTTQRSPEELPAARDFLADRPPPSVETISVRSYGPWSIELNGWYLGDNLLFGMPPTFEAGDLRFDAAGRPESVRPERVPFTLHAPLGPPPARGWPVVIVVHGSGGDERSCTFDEIARRVVDQGAAALCFALPYHGGRGGSIYWAPELNPGLLRGQLRQGALDVVSIVRLIRSGMLESATGAHGVALDEGSIHLFGHSQGAYVAALALAITPHLDSAVLSAAGGGLLAGGLGRVDGVDYVADAARWLDVSPEAVDAFHPLVTFLQMLADATDPVNHGHRWLAPDAGDPAHVLMIAGTDDPLVPVQAADALAAVAGVPITAPAAHRSLPHALRGLKPVELPAAGNVAQAEVAVTAGLLHVPNGDHYAAFRDPEVVRRWTSFLAGALAGEPAIEP